VKKTVVTLAAKRSRLVYAPEFRVALKSVTCSGIWAKRGGFLKDHACHRRVTDSRQFHRSVAQSLLFPFASAKVTRIPKHFACAIAFVLCHAKIT
jgi:hypothetical protein